MARSGSPRPSSSRPSAAAAYANSGSGPARAASRMASRCSQHASRSPRAAVMCARATWAWPASTRTPIRSARSTLRVPCSTAASHQPRRCSAIASVASGNGSSPIAPAWSSSPTSCTSPTRAASTSSPKISAAYPVARVHTTTSSTSLSTSAGRCRRSCSAPRTTSPPRTSATPTQTAARTRRRSRIPPRATPWVARSRASATRPHAAAADAAAVYSQEAATGSLGATSWARARRPWMAAIGDRLPRSSCSRAVWARPRTSGPTASSAAAASTTCGPPVHPAEVGEPRGAQQELGAWVTSRAPGRGLRGRFRRRVQVPRGLGDRRRPRATPRRAGRR